MSPGWGECVGWGEALFISPGSVSCRSSWLVSSAGSPLLAVNLLPLAVGREGGEAERGKEALQIKLWVRGKIEEATGLREGVSVSRACTLRGVRRSVRRLRCTVTGTGTKASSSRQDVVTGAMMASAVLLSGSNLSFSVRR